MLPVLFAANACFIQAQQRVDTTRVYKIDEVVVTESSNMKKQRSATPLQILNYSALKRLSIFQVSDAVKFFSGVTVKDYGGIGGLKTVSIRSLGANHTAVVFDGITITDAQTGQIDLGKLSMENVDAISLNSGQNDNIFQPARLFAAAGVLQINSTRPTFTDKNIHVKSFFKTGSFGLINPGLHLDRKWNKIFSSSISMDYLSSDGKYPYTMENGNATEKLKRLNSDVETYKAETNLYGNFGNNQKASLKAYYYQSERGLPTNILYNTYAGQRLWDKNFFVQSAYENTINKQWSLLVNGKFNWSYNRYYDPAVFNTDGFTDDHYYQNEYYLSGTIMYRPSHHLSFSLSNDGSINSMRADLTDFAIPTRYTLLNAFSIKYITERFSATAHALSTLTKETVKTGTSADNQSRISPSASLSYQLFKEEDIRIRLLYKDIFRLPTFNDLYYGTIGTRTLKPEKAKEFNVGASWLKKINKTIPFISISTDAYYNRITDKIVAMPQKNLFIWSMMNIGRVDIKGIEANIETAFQVNKNFRITAAGNYTYQRALDKTDKYNLPDKITYNHQIPYTPRNSGSARIGLEMPWVNFAYTYLFSGERFYNQYNAPEYRLDGYCEHSLSAYRTFKMNKYSLTTRIEALNFTGNQYEVVKNYPMPGRQFRVYIGFEY